MCTNAHELSNLDNAGYFLILKDEILLSCVQLTSSIKENPRLRAAAEELKKGGVKVGDAVSEALKTMEESDLMRAVSSVPSTLIYSFSVDILVEFAVIKSIRSRVLDYC